MPRQPQVTKEYISRMKIDKVNSHKKQRTKTIHKTHTHTRPVTYGTHIHTGAAGYCHSEPWVCLPPGVHTKGHWCWTVLATMHDVECI